MKISKAGIEALKKREGLQLKAYKDGSVYSIGYGNSFYEDGSKVKSTDSITKGQAETLFANVVLTFETYVISKVVSKLTQNQFDALVSFCYNVGKTGFGTSTLLKKVNVDPNDASIKEEFLRWVNSSGKYLEGLKNRRLSEIDQYFEGTSMGFLSKNIVYIIGVAIILLLVVFNDKTEEET
jgi:lysozyme